VNHIWSAAHTDVGIKKSVNQDSVILKIASSPFGKIAFAVVCDGMGGLQQGEIASGMLSQNYENWFQRELPVLLRAGLTINSFTESLEKITRQTDEDMKQYARTRNVQMGTTATLLLIVENKYYVFHVGDTRVYKITSNNINQLTTDHTYVQQQIQRGVISEAQAEISANKSVLLQCIGASQTFKPEVMEGEISAPTSFLLCSDGFSHKLSKRELFEQLNPVDLSSEELMQMRLQMMTEWNKSRGESDNISAIALKYFKGNSKR